MTAGAKEGSPFDQGVLEQSLLDCVQGSHFWRQENAYNDSSPKSSYPSSNSILESSCQRRLEANSGSGFLYGLTHPSLEVLPVV